MSDQNIPKSFPPLKEGEPTKTFIVAPHCSVGDNDAVRRNGGDKIELSHAQALFLMDRGTIKMHIPEFEDDAGSNSEEASDEPAADTAGDTSVDEPSTDDAPQKKKRAL